MDEVMRQIPPRIFLFTPVSLFCHRSIYLSLPSAPGKLDPIKAERLKRSLPIISIINICNAGTAVAQRLRCCATNQKVAGSISAGVSGFFIDIKFFRSHYAPGVNSASNRNEYQEYFLGVKAPVHKADNLPPSCAIVTKSGNLNFLEPSGLVQACNRTALPI